MSAWDKLNELAEAPMPKGWGPDDIRAGSINKGGTDRSQQEVPAHKRMQITQTKKGNVRFIDDVGRVVCEIPFDVLLKFSGSAGLAIMKKMIPADPTER